MKGTLLFEDGSIYRGKGFGRSGTAVGEMVFNTSITGYQEILTDPSYAGQIVTMTYPLIGNYGVSLRESESEGIYARGMVVKSISRHPSHYSSESTLEHMMQQLGLPGIAEVDTRSITKRIREVGAIKAVISNEEVSEDTLRQLLEGTILEEDWMKKVGVSKPKHILGEGCRVAVLDLGVKANILEALRIRGCDIMLFPYDTSFNEMKSYELDGLLISNGPGNPAEAVKGIELIQQWLEERPIFGICMGHQLLAHAVGGHTFKMKYGHRGGNHGVYDHLKKKAYITSQNHGYVVDTESVIKKGMVITHTNLNDDSLEGMQHEFLPVFSVQFHPEGSPGPQDTDYLFDRFIENMKERKKCL
ncbi:carbamoyl-phosphate synthase small subunit [Tindallia magadiensis]|uniref:Carbamoyl phosphate synthase small chain n=1 Tax=Tindallia magadiensis TaxID=69895 RepID=A0A1I3CF95_9FIRM|nr:glutamine-hydrolyzing carbamoyl-phosphate synthase small subunit [Tindallia magadiensis]SFH72741.1 carbamoyl-phosphate synthase small subunit [Tindallia magadiensis]